MSPAVFEHPALQKLRNISPVTLNFWIVRVLGVFTVYVLSQITWQVIDLTTSNNETRPTVVLNPAASSSKLSEKINVSRIANSHIFGRPEVVKKTAAPVVKTQDKPTETSLNAKLRAVFASTDVKLSNATIELGRDQNVYFIGDRFKGATLREVNLDHVIIERNGRREMLSMEKFAAKGSSSSSTSTRSVASKSSGDRDKKKRVLDKRRDRRATAALLDLRKKVSENPMSVADVITGAPHMKDGQFIGFKIRPGKDRRLFSRLGLRSNDVVTSINGTVLDDPQTAMQMMGQMNSIEELNLSVLRGSQQVDLQFSLKE
ncbi:MAG: type II secretion system protein GspC [Pseudomonadota bacterium]